MSNGYIIFAIDHLDGTNAYTELKDGTEKPFDVTKEIWDFSHRKICAEIRQ